MYRELIGVPTFDRSESDQFAEDPLFVRAVGRAVAVMTAFEYAHRPLSLKEIADSSGVERSAAQRMVNTLLKLGMIVRDEADSGYLPGKRVLTMAYSAMRLNPLLQQAAPVLLELRRRTRERVDMSFWDSTRLIYALRMPSKHEIFTATLTGNTVPLYCTSGGIAVLSQLGDAEIEDIFARSDRTPFTPETFTTLEEVMTEVEQTRKRGHAIALRQLVRHEIAMGVPVLGKDRRPIGAVHLCGNLSEHTAESFSETFGPLLQDAGRSISSFAFR